MRLEALLGSWRDTRRLLALTAVTALCLAAGLVMLVMELGRKERVVVLVPPHLPAETELARSGASLDYLRSWGVFVAATIGNVTPGSVGMVRATLEPLLAPSIHGAVVDRLEAEIDKIQRDRVTSRFEPRRVGVDAAEGRVWVEGYSVVISLGGGEVRRTLTYELVIRVENYRPLIADIRTYEGVARASGAAQSSEVR